MVLAVHIGRGGLEFFDGRIEGSVQPPGFGIGNRLFSQGFGNRFVNIDHRRLGQCQRARQGVVFSEAVGFIRNVDGQHGQCIVNVRNHALAPVPQYRMPALQ